MVQVTFVISNKHDSVIFTKRDMVMRWVIRTAEAAEPVRNDLHEGHCGQKSRPIILMQDVYSQKRGHMQWKKRKEILNISLQIKGY